MAQKSALGLRIGTMMQGKKISERSNMQGLVYQTKPRGVGDVRGSEVLGADLGLIKYTLYPITILGKIDLTPYRPAGK